MTVTTTPRLGVTRWSAAGDPLTRAQMDASHAALEAGVAMYAEGTYAARPAAGKAGRLYRATDTGGFYWDTGTVWLPIGQDLRVYGDAPDGNVTLVSDLTLTRDMYYDTLTVPVGITLKTAGCRIFARTGIVCDGVISMDGNPGVDASSSAQAAGGAALTGVGYLAAGNFAGGATSANWTAGTGGNNGAAPTALTNVGAGGAGGAGGTGASASTGGAGGTVTAPTASVGGVNGWRSLIYALRARTPSTSEGETNLRGGAGGGSGAAGSTVGGGTAAGGGGGGGGGVVVIASPRVTGAGTIRANGGRGGNAWTNGTGGAGAGGGGGGGGGLVIIVTEDPVVPTVQAAGGAGGALAGSGGAGVAGAAGTTLVLRPR